MRIPDPNNKQSSLIVHHDYSNDAIYPESLQNVMNANLGHAYHNAWVTYKAMLDSGVAREMARMVLPVSTYTEFIVTGNFRNWMHFLELRNTPEAQYEIRVYAEAISDILSTKMPISFAALKNA